MLDFPSSPGVGQVVTIGGVTWTWDGVKWTAAGTGTGIYLPLTGGTMTGDLILNRDPVVALGAATKQSVDARGAGDNRIINGDMRIDQRNNGASGTAAGYTVDRWTCAGTAPPKGAYGRNLNAVAGPAGFPYYLGFQTSSAYVAAASETFAFYQPIEADMISDFAWGVAGAQPVTLSFWVRSSLTGTFSGAIQNTTETRSYPFTYSIPTANIWTKIVITILGDTTGTWVLNGNGAGLYLMLDFGSSSALRGPANAWASANYWGATGAVSVVGTLNAIFYLTGVKLEIGSVATPFNRQSLAKSQADCERYFRWLPFNMRFMATAGSFLAQSLSFPAMRAAPTIGTVVADPNATPVNANASGNNFGNITPYSVQQQLIPVAVGDCYVMGYRAPASAEL